MQKVDLWAFPWKPTNFMFSHSLWKVMEIYDSSGVWNSCRRTISTYWLIDAWSFSIHGTSTFFVEWSWAIGTDGGSSYSIFCFVKNANCCLWAFMTHTFALSTSKANNFLTFRSLGNWFWSILQLAFWFKTLLGVDCMNGNSMFLGIEYLKYSFMSRAAL